MLMPLPLNIACSSCNLRELCLPVSLPADELQRLDALVAQRRSVPRGHALFRIGDPFQSVYAVRTGFFKTRVSAEDGRDQVTGFQMAGELLGLRQFHKVMSREIVRDHGVMLLLGSMRAEERLAAF